MLISDVQITNFRWKSILLHHLQSAHLKFEIIFTSLTQVHSEYKSPFLFRKNLP